MRTRRAADEKRAATDTAKIGFELGSGDVFADLGFAEPEVELAKAMISRQIAHEIKARRLTQARAAKVLGIDQPRVSLLVRGRTEDFSLERLLELARRLDYTVNIELSKPGASASRGLFVSVST